MANLTLSSDVPDEVGDTLRATCAPLIHIRRTRRLALFSTDPPSFIQLLADPTEWVVPLKAAVSIFLGQLAKHAADDIWKNKSAIAKALTSSATAPLRTIASAIRAAVTEAGPSTYAAIGVPIDQDPHWGVLLHVPSESVEEAVIAIAIFITNVQAIEATINGELAAGRSFVGHVRIVIVDDRSIAVRWVDKATNEHREALLSSARTDEGSPGAN